MEPRIDWSDLRSRIETLEPESAFVTPVSERQFSVTALTAEYVVIRFSDSEEESTLWGDQFDVLAAGLADHPIRIDGLQPGVEPYVAVLTLSPAIGVEDDEITVVSQDVRDRSSPFVRSPAEARSAPRRLHDDALLLAEHVDRLDVDDPESIDTESLTDCYVLSSDVQRGANRLRKTLRDELLDRLGAGQDLHGRFGTVRRTTRERRSPLDDETVLDVLDDHGVPREWVLGVDRTKLDVVVSVTDVPEDAVYGVEESVYVQKTATDEGKKFDLLSGIADRLDDLEGKAGAEIRDELTEIESRIEEALGAD